MSSEDMQPASSTDVEKNKEAKTANRLADRPYALHDWRLHVGMLGYDYSTHSPAFSS